MHVNSSPASSARFTVKPAAQPLLMGQPPAKVRKLKFGDCHFHPTNYAQQGTPPEQLLATMARLGIKYTVLSPIPTNVLVQCGSCTGHDWAPAEGRPVETTNYYIAQTRVRNSFFVSRDDYEKFISDEAPLYYNTAVDSGTAHVFNQLSAEHKAFFDPMVTGLVLGDARSAESLLRKLDEHPSVFTGVGEITVFKEWVQRKVEDRLQANLTASAAALAMASTVALTAMVGWTGRSLYAVPAFEHLFHGVIGVVNRIGSTGSALCGVTRPAATVDLLMEMPREDERSGSGSGPATPRASSPSASSSSTSTSSSSRD